MIELKTGQDVLDLLCNVTAHDARHVRIHPDAARALLELNTTNRVIMSRHVETLARVLREGGWQLINNGIAISDKGDLVDGQHRLTAVVLANVAAEFWLHTGQDVETRAVIDVGKKRSLADLLTMAGYGRSRNTEAAALSLLYRYDTDDLFLATGGSIGAPNDVLIDYVQQSINFDQLSRCVGEAHAVQHNTPQFNRSALAALLYLAYSRDVFIAAAFVERLRTGADLRNGDPELTLRNTVARLERSSNRSYRNTWHFCLYAKAWNARRKNKSIHILRFLDTENVPEVR